MTILMTINLVTEKFVIVSSDVPQNYVIELFFTAR